MRLLHDFLRHAAARDPDGAAITHHDRTLPFAELLRRAEHVACSLRTRGVERGDRVAMLLDNSDRFAACVFGALMAGGVIVPIAPSTRPPRLRSILADCEPCVIVADASNAGLARDGAAGASIASTVVVAEELVEASAPAPPRVADPGTIDLDLAAIIYTSGTTAEPRGVMLTHRNLVNTNSIIAEYLGNGPQDRVCCALPLSFSYGLCQLFAGVFAGATLALERAFTFPQDLLRRIEAGRITGLPAVPTMVARLLDAIPASTCDLGSLRYITTAAAPLPPAHARRLRELLPHVDVIPMYGQTECTRATYLPPPLVDAHPDSAGRPIRNCETVLIDDAGDPAPDGAVGELVIRGSNVMRGYWRRPDDTKRALQPWGDTGDLALHTGDLFRRDAAGLHYFVGRRDDVFKCRGEKVSPREVESTLCECPDIAEAAIIGVPHPVDGHAIKAVIVPRAGASVSEQSIRRFCLANLDPALMPHIIEIRAELPRTDSGKLRRRDLAVPTTGET
jgi:long-chain acyl-CoA synthetase